MKPPTSFTFKLHGVAYSASYRGVTEGVGPRYTLFQCGQDIGLVWHCPDGWKTWRHSAAHPDIQGATQERLESITSVIKRRIQSIVDPNFDLP